MFPRRCLLSLFGALALAATLAAPAGASATFGARQIVVRAAGARAVITRSPFGVAFADGRGRPVLRESAGAGGVMPVPPVVQSQFGRQTPPGPALYAPLGFLVGSHSVQQTPGSQWEGTLSSVTEGGVAYSPRAVIDARSDGAGVLLTLSTSDPTGRRLVVRVVPQGSGAVRISARPSPATGVVTMSDSFASPATEAFHGFGGRHDSLDQRGHEFYNWLQQENLSSGSADGLTAPAAGDRYLFPNGASAAYYVQSSFVSSQRYGFLLDRDEISHWRLAYDKPSAWQVSSASSGLDYVVAPGAPAQALGTLTHITGRQRVPPAWAAGTELDREVRYPSDPPAQHLGEIEDDLRQMRRYHLPLDGYRIEGWQFLPRATLRRLIGELRRRHIHPLLYFRAFVGQDTIGTDSPSAYDEALAKGYVATRSTGQPYTFPSNFNALGAQIDFTKPSAVKWWQGRIREALDLGADGFMQDFGEQVLGDMHFADGTTGLVQHNRLAVLFHRATRIEVDAYQRSHPNRHVFFFTRAGYTGTPGTAAYENANFPGDETTDWTRSAGLASQTTDMLNRAIGGAFGFTTDIGGYFDVGPYKATTRELFDRWAEWAALSPFFRLHGSLLAGTHTPWSYDRSTAWLYNALSRMHLRARPLILRLWRTAVRTGIPMTRPLWLTATGDREAARQDQEWMLGPDVLVAPVVNEGARSRRVYFPAGCWTEPESGARYHGSHSVTIRAGQDELPYFLRCGRRPFAPFDGSAGKLAARRRCGAPVGAVLARPRRGERIVSAKAYVNARRALALSGENLGRRLALRGVPGGRLRLRLVTRTDLGRTLGSARTYPACRR